jgi:hypothetical protein
VSRPAVAAICGAVLVAGFVAGRVTGSRSAGTAYVTDTVERAVVITAKHVGSATDARDGGPLDLARVSSVRRANALETTIVARRPWRDSLLRGGRVELAIVYDVNDDGKPDRRDVLFLLHGRLASWISNLAQGIQAADVTRRSATTITVTRDATVFYSASGQERLLATSPIGVAVVAHWQGGGDRVPDHGWIVVPPPG